MGKFAGIALALALIGAFFASSATVQALFGPEPELYLQHPIQYRAVVCQSGHNDPTKCRFYTKDGK